METNYNQILILGDIIQIKVQIEMSPPNSIHMLWLIPQYFVLTVAEVMYAVSGNQFAFTQVFNSNKIAQNHTK